MKTNTYKSVGLSLILLSLSFSFTQCSEGAGMDQDNAFENELLGIDIQSQQLIDAEIEGILFMREEEKLARDVYLYLYELHSLRTFLNISRSEQAHMDAIKYLIDKIRKILQKIKNLQWKRTQVQFLLKEHLKIPEVMEVLHLHRIKDLKHFWKIKAFLKFMK